MVASELADFFHNTSVQVLLTVAVILTIQLILHNSIGRIIERAVRSHKYSSKNEERQREDTLKKVFQTIITIALWIIGAIIILWQLDVNILALLTGAGLVGVIAGLGAQNIIKDAISGIFIILENQYRVDDIVTLDAGGTTASGVVEDITIRITKLRDLDGNLHIVTNGSINVITNRSFHFANVNVDINVSYDADLDVIEKIINEVGIEVAGNEKWKSSIIEAIQFYQVDAFNDSSVTVKALGKVQPGTQWDIASDFRRRLKTAFAKHHIAPAYAHVILHERKK